MTIAIAAVGLVCLGLGMTIGRFGVFARLTRIEDQIRGLANGAHQIKVLEGLDTVPIDWVVEQLDTIAARELRR